MVAPETEPFVRRVYFLLGAVLALLLSFIPILWMYIIEATLGTECISVFYV